MFALKLTFLSMHTPTLSMYRWKQGALSKHMKTNLVPYKQVSSPSRCLSVCPQLSLLSLLCSPISTICLPSTNLVLPYKQFWSKSATQDIGKPAISTSELRQATIKLLRLDDR